MHSRVRTIGAVVLLVGTVLWAASPALADGITSVPARITIDNGFRGAEYSRSIAFQNDFDDEGEFLITAEGEIADWITVTDLDGNPVTTVAALPGVEVELIAVVTVPEDAPNAGYEGSINTQLIRPAEDDNAVDVRFGIVMPVSIDVTGEEIIAGSFLELTVGDGEVGLLQRITIVVQNSGNVAQMPDVDLEILDDTGTVVHSATPTVDIVSPGTTRNLQLEWDTSQERPGPYTARVGVAFGDLDLGTREGSFTLAPRGTLTRSGELLSLQLGGDVPLPGGVARVLAEYSNTGGIESRVELVGELFRDGTLISTVNTPPSLVLPGVVKTIEAFIDIEAPGSYALVARVNFEGQETEALTLEFVVDPLEGNGDGDGVPFLVLGGVGLVIAAGVAGFVISRRRRDVAMAEATATERLESLQHDGEA